MGGRRDADRPRGARGRRGRGGARGTPRRRGSARTGKPAHRGGERADRSFGLIPDGAPPYRDPGSEEMRLLRAFELRTVFPPAVRRAAARLPEDPRETDRRGRVDRRRATVFTIDGDDAQDFDDAIEVAARRGGGHVLTVHVADVGHYVRPGSALDAEAFARGTSVYLPDQVLPMLPEELSNGLCSLVEGRDRLAFSVRMEFDRSGRRTDARVEKSVVRSRRRCTYAAVQGLLDGRRDAAARALAPLRPPLRELARWTRHRRALRDEAGALRIEGESRRFRFDADHLPVAIDVEPRTFSQAMIEETALAANEAVGEIFRARGLPTLYRVHRAKGGRELARLREELARHGLAVPDEDRLNARAVGRLVRQARGAPNADALVSRVLGLLERAVYEAHGDERGPEHFGLARRAYLHFTSPIRRYPDLFVHRWLHALQRRPRKTEEALRGDAFLTELNAVAAHCSERAEVAEMAAAAVADLKTCQLVEPHVGRTFDARVRRVVAGGLVVELEALRVTSFLPATALGRDPRTDDDVLRVRRDGRRRTFREGDPLRVRVRGCDRERLRVQLEAA